MIENSKLMMCGACGCESFSVYNDNKSLYTECKVCKSVSEVTISKPKLTIEWTDNAQGILCIKS
jgi:hypothetical protein